MICYYLFMQLTIVAHPNSKRKSGIVLDDKGQLHAYVNVPPEDGKANAAIIALLAKHFGVAKSNITLIHGHNRKMKHFEIK